MLYICICRFYSPSRYEYFIYFKLEIRNVILIKCLHFVRHFYIKDKKTFVVVILCDNLIRCTLYIKEYIKTNEHNGFRAPPPPCRLYKFQTVRMCLCARLSFFRVYNKRSNAHKRLTSRTYII